jgi:hypothetical protein
MTKKIKQIFTTASFAFLCTSCDPESYFNQVENVDTGDFKSTLTPNCQISEGLPAVVSVEATKPAFGNSMGYEIKGSAIVNLYENDVLQGTYKKDSIDFSNNYFNAALFNFKPGKAYKLEVTHPNYPTCTALDTMPARVNFTVVNTGKVIYKTENLGSPGTITDTFIEIQITFLDGPTNDYYRIVLSDSNFNLSDGTGGPQLSFANRLPISYDPIFSEGLEVAGGENIVYPNETFFDDLLFNGKQKTISLYMPIGNLPQFGGGGPGQPDFSIKPKLYVALQHHSRASFLRNKSLQNVLNSSGNPFSQPPLLFCNTIGGFGILATSSTQIDSVKIK